MPDVTDRYVSPKVHSTKSQLAAEAVREAILGGRLRPGQRLLTRDLENMLGLSATPIREALRALESEGFVVNSPHRGICVARFDTNDAKEIYDIRAVMEGHAAALTAEQMQPDEHETLDRLVSVMADAVSNGDMREVKRTNQAFHEQIWKSSGSVRLRTMCSDLWRAFPWGTLRRSSPDRPAQSLEEHREIVDRIRSRDGQGAARAMERHVRNALSEHLASVTAETSQSDAAEEDE